MGQFLGGLAKDGRRLFLTRMGSLQKATEIVASGTTTTAGTSTTNQDGFGVSQLIQKSDRSLASPSADLNFICDLKCCNLLFANCTCTDILSIINYCLKSTTSVC